MDSGDYRWAIQVLHHLVFADPDDTEAKELQADAYEQLGYQQEVPQYRDIFLTAAEELREVVSEGRFNTDSQHTILAMPIDLLFDFIGVRIIGDKASEVDFRINFTFAEHGDEWTMWVRNGVLNARKSHVEGAQLSVSGSQAGPCRCAAPAR
jgi:alkyl sulfatase BDS1-like metallo-beta-lactamase superfamily hydrolase